MSELKCTTCRHSKNGEPNYLNVPWVYCWNCVHKWYDNYEQVKKEAK